MPENSRIALKKMEVANTLAYYDTATMTAKQSFLVQTPGACPITLLGGNYGRIVINLCHCLSPTPKSNISRQGRTLLELKPLCGSTLIVGS